jgi:hypothetical protein
VTDVKSVKMDTLEMLPHSSHASDACAITWGQQTASVITNLESATVRRVLGDNIVISVLVATGDLVTAVLEVAQSVIAV